MESKENKKVRKTDFIHQGEGDYLRIVLNFYANIISSITTIAFLYARLYFLDIVISYE